MKRRGFITLLGGVAIVWHALNDHRILLGSDWRCCKQTSRGSVHDDAHIEDPLSHSDMCSRVYPTRNIQRLRRAGGGASYLEYLGICPPWHSPMKRFHIR